jgi:multiple sugar transport system substrate-binding protein
VKFLSLLGIFSSFFFLSCGNPNRPSPKKPVTLTVWHTYVEQMKTGFDKLADEFNATVGARQGITVTVTSVANASIVNEKLLMAANGDPGAPEFPDMAVAYPSIAVTLARKGLLMDFASQFSKDEIHQYVDEFIEEGTIAGKLHLLPVSKSTEVLFVNKTIFDRFAKAAGVTLNDLETFEGIIDAAEKYYVWSGGKTFYYPDALFNYTMIGMEQMGEPFVKDEKLNVSSPGFKRIWNSYYGPAANGLVAIFNNFGNYLAITGDVVAITSTSAGAMFYPNSVTYKDNTKEEVEFIVLPFPVFAGGEKVAAQRGGGMCVIKSTAPKEYAAAVFLKWFTSPEQNLRFTASTGYIPVTKQAFDDVSANSLDTIDNELIKKAFLTALEMQKEYRFYIPPVFDGFDALQNRYIQEIQKGARDAKTSPYAVDSDKALFEFISVFGE